MLNIGRYGRFCNALFQVAGILGIAKANNLEPVFPPLINHDHRDRFGSEEDVDLYKYFVNGLPPIPEGIQWQPERPQAWGYHDIRLGSGNWNLSGHFQSSRYFENCMDQVRHYFRMKDEPPQNDYVAIHIRLGDYDNLYHPRLDMDYYGPAMALFPGAKFLVFSDEMEAAKRMFGDRAEYSEGKDYLGDFKQMKQCQHFIIGNSSYSAMAAILGEANDKRVVAPYPWFGPAWHPGMVTNRDVYSPEWTVINWQQAA